MAEYSKLFGSILDSSLMEEPVVTRWIWTVMLAMKDKYGVVSASVGGLARRAGVKREELEVALAAFLSPDPDSRTKDDEGRRIEVVDGGWRLLNHQKYRDLESLADRREKDAARQKRRRDKNAGEPMSREPSRDVTPERDNHGIRSETDQGSVSSPLSLVRGSDPDPDSNAGASSEPWPGAAQEEDPVWSAAVWQRNFNLAWSKAYNTMALPWGGEAAARASANLGDMLAKVEKPDRMAIQERAPGMFAEFLSDCSQALVKARHPWAWFVTRFQGLLAPAKLAEVRPRDVTVGHCDQVQMVRTGGPVKL